MREANHAGQAPDMTQRGFLYVLINPSMPGVVKIGRTEGDTQTRADQLSSATGVPSPFVVAFEQYFEDVVAAEMSVHAFLEASGHRQSARREFFAITPTEAITAILRARTELANSEVDGRTDGVDDDTSEQQRQALHDAEAYYLFTDPCLRDPKKAVRLYRLAAALGSVDAMLRAGKIYRDDFEDLTSAESWFREAALRGSVVALAELAMTYGRSGKRDLEIRCWNQFFDAAHTLGEEAVEHAYNYLLRVRFDRTRDIAGDRLKVLAPQLNRYIQELDDIQRQRGSNSLANLHDLFRRRVGIRSRKNTSGSDSVSPASLSSAPAEEADTHRNE
jgi:T5orf172 domain